MRLWASYIFPGLVHIFSCSRVGRSIVGIYITRSQNTWMWKLGMWPRNSFIGSICFEFSVLVLCSATLLCARYEALLHSLNNGIEISNCLKDAERRKIRLKEGNANYRHIKNWPVKGLCGRLFIRVLVYIQSYWYFQPSFGFCTLQCYVYTYTVCNGVVGGSGLCGRTPRSFCCCQFKCHSIYSACTIT